MPCSLINVYQRYGVAFRLQNQSQSYFTAGGLPPISSSWRQAPWDSRLVIFQLNTCGYNPYVTSSLTRGWVCHLQLLLLASAANLRSESLGTHDHILLFQIWDSPPTWRTRSPYLYSSGTGWPGYTPRHWVTFRRLLPLAGPRWRYSTPPSFSEVRRSVQQISSNRWSIFIRLYGVTCHKFLFVKKKIMCGKSEICFRQFQQSCHTVALL
jgi:hypothetical protein